MGFIDWLTGRDSQPAARPAPPQARQRTEDEIAIERYRYLLRTAPPEAIEQAHAEAFARLTPAQRAQVFQELSAAAPAGEAPADDSASALARAATRSEIRSPGSVERTFAGRPGGMSFGSTLASSMLGTIAGYVIATAVVDAFLPDAGSTDAAGADADPGTDAGSDSGADAGGDYGASADGGSWDGGGGFGGGDVGGGDFGGGFDF